MTFYYGKTSCAGSFNPGSTIRPGQTVEFIWRLSSYSGFSNFRLLHERGFELRVWYDTCKLNAFSSFDLLTALLMLLGICEPLDANKCEGKNDFVSCDELCDGVKEDG